MADAEIIQLGSAGRAGRGSRSTPSAAARGLAPARRTERARPVPPTLAGDDADPTLDPASAPLPDASPDTDATAEPDPDVGLRATDGADPEEGTDADEVPLTLGGLVGDLTGLLGQALRGLTGVPVEDLRAAAANPWDALLRLMEALGIEQPDSWEETLAFARSRIAGDYAVDDFGFDPEFTERVFLPLLRPLVRSWFRVEVRGAENLPADGSALLVSNHAGTMPLDGMVLHAVVHDEIGRHVRMLGADLIFSTPFSHDLARRTGTTLACQEDAERLLASDQLVAVFPEGFKGLGKAYADRYKLQRFGRGGFVSAAVRAQVPIIPVSIVGSEEIYPLLATAPTLARAMGVPYFPVTPLFPWLGVLGLVPLPSKWIIQIGEAIATDELPAGAAEDPMVVFNVTDQVRETIQQTLYRLLTERRSVFF
ncbi:MAG: putative acyltransferase [Friedmanniella sp.]|nr:putative acyltransferase [Friedmanniella sp.]